LIFAEFIEFYEQLLPKTLFGRLEFLFGLQSWEHSSSHYWLIHCLDFLLPLLQYVPRPSKTVTEQRRLKKDLATIVHEADALLKQVNEWVMSPAALTKLYRQNTVVAHQLWIELFPVFWSLLTPNERHDIKKAMAVLLASSYHAPQAELRPNVIQSLMEGFNRCGPAVHLAPELVMYLGETFNCWHASMEWLQDKCENVSAPHAFQLSNPEKIRDASMDALSSLYSSLNENDMFYGLWRRRSLLPETNAALSFEQVGMWQQAQSVYENAQQKARHGLLPFNESECAVWEKRWINCTQKLQQWDLLHELGMFSSTLRPADDTRKT
jgi:transformation/transcription domain-associated protein